jgi:hypothetical protein
VQHIGPVTVDVRQAHPVGQSQDTIIGALDVL